MKRRNKMKELERRLHDEKCDLPEQDLGYEPPWDETDDPHWNGDSIYIPWRTRKLSDHHFINSFKAQYMHDENQYELEPHWIPYSQLDENDHNMGMSMYRCKEALFGKPPKRIKRKETKQVKSIMITGHRPNKLPGGYNMESAPNKLLEETLYKILCKAQPTSIITGMALGVDQIFLKAAIRYKEIDPRVNLIAAVPCKDQATGAGWPDASVKLYNDLLAQCNTVKVLSEKYTNNCMKERNQWMVDHCTSAIAVYDGTSGGTQHAINLLCKAKKTVLIIHPVTGKHEVILKGVKQ
jgi:uncharacterized phage-like protein YoqJ